MASGWAGSRWCGASTSVAARLQAGSSGSCASSATHPVARLELAGDGGERAGEASRHHGLERAAQLRREGPQPCRGVEQRLRLARPGGGDGARPRGGRPSRLEPHQQLAAARLAQREPPRVVVRPRSGDVQVGRAEVRRVERRERPLEPAAQPAERVRRERRAVRGQLGRRSGPAKCAAGRAGRRAAGRGPRQAAGPATASRPAARAAGRGGRGVPPARSPARRPTTRRGVRAGCGRRRPGRRQRRRARGRAAWNQSRLQAGPAGAARRDPGRPRA